MNGNLNKRVIEKHSVFCVIIICMGFDDFFKQLTEQRDEFAFVASGIEQLSIVRMKRVIKNDVIGRCHDAGMVAMLNTHGNKWKGNRGILTYAIFGRPQFIIGRALIFSHSQIRPGKDDFLRTQISNPFWPLSGSNF